MILHLLSCNGENSILENPQTAKTAFVDFFVVCLFVCYCINIYFFVFLKGLYPGYQINLPLCTVLSLNLSVCGR